MKRNVESLNEVLFQVAEKTPEKTLYRFLDYLQNDEIKENTITYEEFSRKAHRIAAHLQQLKAAGERALLLYLPGLDYIMAYFGCLLSGVIAVPVYVPMSVKQLGKLKHIADNCEARFMLTTTSIVNMAETMEEFRTFFGHLQLVTTDKLPADSSKIYREAEINRESVAFLQYTSGSTANPRGVIVSHGNLLHNLSIITQYFQLDDTQYVHEFSWLPPYHDMGLIGGILAPLYLNGTGTLISPIDFLRKPLRWLQALSTYRCNVSGGPNFAYDLCVKKILDADCKSLDLSIWKIAYNGAEMIRPATLDAFYNKFKACGYKKETFYPCYGMAEATLLISGADPNSLPIAGDFDSKQLSCHKAVPAQKETDTVTLVGSGTNPDSQEIRIIDPVTLESCPDGDIGEIWVAGPSIASGYWNQPEDYIQRTFRAITATGEGPYLRTGDLGFLKESELFVTGRLKDMIIVRGRNLYPHDIEDTIAAVHPACRPGCGAVFGVDVDGNEAVVAVQEIHKAYAEEIDIDGLIVEIKAQISENHGVGIYKLILIRHGSIPKTSSGKLQRNECKTAFLTGKLAAVELTGRSVSRRPVGDCDEKDSALVQKNAAADTVESESGFHVTKIRTWLLDYITGKLDVPPSQVDIDAPLSQFVANSMDVMILSGELEQWLGKRVSPTLFYDFPTISLLSQKLSGSLPAMAKGTDKKRFRAGSTNSRQDQGIAVIGMGCRFPGGVRTPGEFWEILTSGVNTVRKFPEERKMFMPEDRNLRADRLSTAASIGGYIDDVDKFDAPFFNILAREAEAADPQQRLLLETSWHALEDAGIKPSALAGSRTGVFIGMASSDYARLYGKVLANRNLYSGIGNAASMAANRISYFYNFKGPSLAMDTACSSSLVAVHQACASLNSYESDVALAGGVNIILDKDINLLLARAGMLSLDGKCKAFDKSADGYIRGEGCGLVVLKRLADAVEDEDDIIAVIAGSAVNQDGRSNGITAPNGPAQESLLREALENADIAPNQIGFVEAHGTGTSLGDPIEVNTLAKTFMPGRSIEQPLFVGSVKTNIGHLEAAAGIAGLIKTVLCLKYGRIPANLHLKEINPRITSNDAPLLFPIKTSHFFNSDDMAYAGVSSFSFGGTNAHVILRPFRTGDREDAKRASDIRAASPATVLISLSAQNEERLRQVAASLLAYIQKIQLSEGPGKTSFNLIDLAYTLQCCREAMPQRLAFVVSDSVELIRRLTDFCQGAKPQKGMFYGNAKRDKRYCKLLPNERIGGDRASVDRDLAHLGRLWTSGFNPDWRFIYQGLKPRRMTLPPYPFERQHHWAGSSIKTRRQRSSFLSNHPLLGQVNMAASLGSGMVFENILQPDLPLLADHIIDGRKVMTKTGFMEIAVAAGAQFKLGQRVSLSGMKWFSPLVVSQKPVKLSTILAWQKETLCFKIVSTVKNKNILHAKGRYKLCGNNGNGCLKDFFEEPLFENDTSFIGQKCIYQAIGSVGLQFGHDFQVLEEVRCRPDQGEALGILQNSAGVGEAVFQTYHLPIALIDGAFQTAGMLMSSFQKEGATSLMVPHKIDTFELGAAPTETCYAFVRLTSGRSFDISIFTDNKEVCIRMQGVAFRNYGDSLLSIIDFPPRRPNGDYLQKEENIHGTISVSRRQT